MGVKKPRGADADYFQVQLASGNLCGHFHESIESAARCKKENDGTTVIAMKKRRDAIATEKLYNKDFTYLSERDIQRIIEWTQHDRSDESR